jgi:aspartate-semialdehyde dehydrogenase
MISHEEHQVKNLGIIGQRGMVGSVLMGRMKEENDFAKFKSFFFSTSQNGQTAPVVENGHNILMDAYSIEELTEMDIIISCQGGDYTKKIHTPLRESGWKGYWIDAASTLRMSDDAVIILDPVNAESIQQALNNGGKDFVGGNCTVSLMLLALGGLFKEGVVEWMSSMTYQAASGAGAKNMIELIDQMNYTTTAYNHLKTDHPSFSAIDMERKLTSLFTEATYPQANFGAPLNLNLLPWIDSEVESGQSREEWKAQVEANKILKTSSLIPIDGTCVRVGALRCHSQAFTIKLNKTVDIQTIEQMIGTHNDWVKFIPNNKEASMRDLTPAAVTGKLDIPIGRVRKMTIGDQYLNAFSVGDQLLWGAAEPLRRMLHFIS